MNFNMGKRGFLGLINECTASVQMSHKDTGRIDEGVIINLSGMFAIIEGTNINRLNLSGL
jgi:hypothetical protein